MSNKYQDVLDYFTDFSKALIVPDVGMVKVMFIHKQKEAEVQAARLEKIQAEHELHAREAYTRLSLFTQSNHFKGDQ